METGGVPLLLLGVLAAVRAATVLGCPSKFLTHFQHNGVPCCSACQPGFFLEIECSKTSNFVCKPCPHGSYSTQWNNLASCLRCDDCRNEGMQYKRNCTQDSNAQCECNTGYVCKDSDCKRCIPQGTFSDTGTKPSQPWTNYTSLDYVETPPGNQMITTICDNSTKITLTLKAKESSNKKEVATAIVAFSILFLLGLSIGLHVVTLRKKRNRDYTLSPDEAQATTVNTLCKKNSNVHYPEQECGGTPCLDRKSMKHTSVDIPCV
ncbi:tumor necrosis factor receptor superfamily member 14-like [Hypanus sabinus]|uniref:tumor necrosis factor receptor superfamily member 14-like n=1 Tax=Hypanus sabinus TaxID=79690 RepID=UPI0028C4A8E9|nr:tumor necrosis factor receptor superfamily member 14-like [Hypanus sabinus]